MGVLGWTPDAFWRSTAFDLYPAIDGYLERIGKKAGDVLTDEDVDDLMAMLEEAD